MCFLWGTGGIGFIVKSTHNIRLYQPNFYYIENEFLNAVLRLSSWGGICASDKDLSEQMSP